MTHITQEQRYTIYSMLAQDYKQDDIAAVIQKSPSSVSREIKRNSDKRNGEYKADLAQKKYEQRHKEKPKVIKFTSYMQESVEALLKEEFSPEQIVGVMKLKNKEIVSIERIYQHIWIDKANKGSLFEHLRRKSKRYRKRGSQKDSRGRIKNRKSIDDRPKVVDEKLRFGDLEVDLIIGANHKEALVTINDRVSGFLKMKKVRSKQAERVREVIEELLLNWKPYILTITSDNGKEFTQHQEIAKTLEIDYYFAHPYRSWERGANENLNGLVRQYFPKKSSFTNLTDKRIQEVANKLNNRPRKRLGYETPEFIMKKLLLNN